MGKLENMYLKFGKAAGKCKDCRFFTRRECGKRTVSKCLVYGSTASAASDWGGTWGACGLFPGGDWDGVRVMGEQIAAAEEEQLPGQTNIFDFLEE